MLKETMLSISLAAMAANAGAVDLARVSIVNAAGVRIGDSFTQFKPEPGDPFVFNGACYEVIEAQYNAYGWLDSKARSVASTLPYASVFVLEGDRCF